MLPLLSAAFLAGLVGSPHCLAMCGPFALACGRRMSSSIAWQTGKLFTYAALGGLAGLVGKAVPGPAWIAAAISAGLVVWFSASLAGWAPEPTVRLPGLQRLAARAAADEKVISRFTFGVANGLLPCGLVYAALGMAVASGHAGRGAALMTAFGLGTAPLLTTLSVGGRKLARQGPWVRRSVALLILVTGLWTVSRRFVVTSEGVRHLHPPGQEQAHDNR
jgi:sulfite exporter TauE/SafE